MLPLSKVNPQPLVQTGNVVGANSNVDPTATSPSCPGGKPEPTPENENTPNASVSIPLVISEDARTPMVPSVMMSPVTVRALAPVPTVKSKLY